MKSTKLLKSYQFPLKQKKGIDDCSFQQNELGPLEANSILIPKAEKDIVRIYKPLPFMNIDVKIPSKILANQIQQHMKRIINHEQVGFVRNARVSSTFKKQ
jgi:hypothetical protein